ncbi:MAG: metal-dependent hydrolase [Streptosporangiales bacterium]|jgi:hypothetical protein|nr:metal-dependent hydrolase [Streptosporangiales bacterium]
MVNKTHPAAGVATADATEPGPVALQPRDVQFDWAGLPLRWMPDEPVASHILSVLHLLLPEGETWFVKVFKDALPLITDDRLREDVIGFIGQEAMHASAHQGVLDYYTSAGVDTSRYIRHVQWLFARILGHRPGMTEAAQRELLIEQVSIIAAIEHFTAMMGAWVLDATALDAASPDPRMLDLLRWHGSEEVEHRAVAFDVMAHFDPGYARRARALLMVAPLLTFLWARGAKYFANADKNHDFSMSWSAYFEAAKRGLLPAPGPLGKCALRWFRRDYHPSQDYSTGKAVAYLATSPAARAAEH